MTADQLLQSASVAGAAYCAAAYLYAFVLQSKGDRRFHVASLMFSGMALAALAVLTPSAAQGPGLFATGSLTVFLLASVLCQSLSAFRGRKSDRRAADEGRVNAPAGAVLKVVPERPARAA